MSSCDNELSQALSLEAAQNMAMREGERKVTAMENMQSSPSVKAILTTLRQMPIAELEELVDQVIAIRAERVAPHLTADESALMTRINKACLPKIGPGCARSLKGATMRQSRQKNGRN
jgi:hypothetical protein